MSLKHTLSTQHWNTISKKCKNCSKAIYTLEDSKVYYQCSIYGSFKKECNVNSTIRSLPKPEEILKLESN